VAAQRASYDEYEVLVRALLSVAKVKSSWSQIEPDPHSGTSLSAQSYREQLELNIGRQIASLDPRGHSLAGFFTWLKQLR